MNLFKNKDLVIIVVFLVLLFLYFWLVNKQNKEAEKFIENYEPYSFQQQLNILDVACEENDSECIEHTDSTVIETFDTEQKQKPIILLFYANWCTHCKNLKPEWDRFKDNVSQQKQQQQLNVQQTRNVLDKLVNLDVAEYEESNTEDSIRNQFDIKGYPTIMLLTPDGKKTTYNGPRTAEGLVQFVNNNI